MMRHQQDISLTLMGQTVSLTSDVALITSNYQTNILNTLIMKMLICVLTVIPSEYLIHDCQTYVLQPNSQAYYDTCGFQFRKQ